MLPRIRIDEKTIEKGYSCLTESFDLYHSTVEATSVGINEESTIAYSPQPSAEQSQIIEALAMDVIAAYVTAACQTLLLVVWAPNHYTRLLRDQPSFSVGDEIMFSLSTSLEGRI